MDVAVEAGYTGWATADDGMVAFVAQVPKSSLTGGTIQNRR